MSIYLNTTVFVDDSPKADYRPAHDYTYGKDGQYQGHADAAVWIDLGRDARLALGIEEARALVTGLARALCEHKQAIADTAATRVDLVKVAA
ncbi:hypothetical protein [Nocardia suismassiliense]|uniref:hypothetical protein n=1 Tax=Nocardia suismassiliense TaxID=2077092 RepID=UPI000D1F6D88|nr:hypothetical protein [Nocardia suismassiliense]